MKKISDLHIEIPWIFRKGNVDKKSVFYKNCVKQRKRGAKICNDCPFRKLMETVDR